MPGLKSKYKTPAVGLPGRRPGLVQRPIDGVGESLGGPQAAKPSAHGQACCPWHPQSLVEFRTRIGWETYRGLSPPAGDQHNTTDQ